MVAVSTGWYFLISYLFTSEPMVRGCRWIDRLAGSMLVLLDVKLVTESK
jgi:hypothetical protein